MQASVSAAWRQFNEPIEGLTSWMYLDVKGLVTTGMGNLIDPLAVALTLPWVAADGTAASQGDISAEWNRTKGNLILAHQGAQAAKAIATLSLPLGAIDKIIQAKLARDEALVTSYPPFAGFEGWPADAQLGLLSMAYPRRGPNSIG
jgi:hypothetical protein